MEMDLPETRLSFKDEDPMKNITKVSLIFHILILSVVTTMGCNNQAQRTIALSLFEGMHSVASGLIDGLHQQLFPDSITSSSNSLVSLSAKSDLTI